MYVLNHTTSDPFYSHPVVTQEKLCLLVMSMPIYILLSQNMMDALEFILTKVLGSVSELMQVWLKVRNIEKLSEAMHVVATKG